MDLKPMHVTGPGVCVTSPGIPGTSEESSSASSTRGSFKRKPPVPIVDIQVNAVCSIRNGYKKH